MAAAHVVSTEAEERNWLPPISWRSAYRLGHDPLEHLSADHRVRPHLQLYALLDSTWETIVSCGDLLCANLLLSGAAIAAVQAG